MAFSAPVTRWLRNNSGYAGHTCHVRGRPHVWGRPGSSAQRYCTGNLSFRECSGDPSSLSFFKKKKNRQTGRSGRCGFLWRLASLPRPGSDIGRGHISPHGYEQCLVSRLPSKGFSEGKYPGRGKEAIGGYRIGRARISIGIHAEIYAAILYGDTQIGLDVTFFLWYNSGD